MSKYARARPKAVDDLPEWARCCSEKIDYSERIIDLEDQQNGSNIYCPNCLTIRNTGLRGVKVISGPREGEYITLELLEIDEGEFVQ